MNYKTFLPAGLSFLFFLLTAMPAQANNNDPNPIVKIESLETKADFEQAYETLKDHVQQLKVAKKEAVTQTDKDMVKDQIKETKNEIKAVKAKAVGKGIYIGSGVLVLLIVLLLIL